jgi:hypothetical protein
MPLYSRREGLMIKSEEAFSLWAPDGVVWSQWAKPAPFVYTGGIMVGDPIDDATLPVLPLDLDIRSAVIVDLPGGDAVRAGLALADRGFRPVPLFNGTSGPLPVVDVTPIVEALGGGADRLRHRTIPADAAPAFLLDSRRRTGTPRPGMYDNRWVALPQDFPSGALLRSNGIHHATVIQQNRHDIPEDLAHVLRRWQEHGIRIHTLELATGGRTDVTVPRPSWFRLAWYAAVTVLSLRRSNVGGFGGMVPEQSSGGYG